MSTIQLEIDDALLQSVGITAIQAFMQEQMALLRLQYQGDRIARQIRQSGLDHDQEVSDARQEAWEEYKATHLQDLL
jgi:hypothetical protein